MNEHNSDREGMLHIQVRGEKPGLWQEFRPKLIKAIHQCLDTVIDHNRGTTVRVETKELSVAVLDFAKAKLAKAGFENDRIEAEVLKLYAERSSELAKARKTDAEAARIEFDTAVRELRLMLGATKAMLIGDEDKEALLLGKQIDAWLEAVKELMVKA